MPFELLGLSMVPDSCSEPPAEVEMGVQVGNACGGISIAVGSYGADELTVAGGQPRRT